MTARRTLTTRAGANQGYVRDGWPRPQVTTLRHNRAQPTLLRFSPSRDSYGCGRPNVFQGRTGTQQNPGQFNSVTWLGVPLDPPGTTSHQPHSPLHQYPRRCGVPGRQLHVHHELHPGADLGERQYVAVHQQSAADRGLRAEGLDRERQHQPVLGFLQGATRKMALAATIGNICDRRWLNLSQGIGRHAHLHVHGRLCQFVEGEEHRHDHESGRRAPRLVMAYSRGFIQLLGVPCSAATNRHHRFGVTGSGEPVRRNYPWRT